MRRRVKKRRAASRLRIRKKKISFNSGDGENRMQRIYEVMFIVRPDMPDEELDKLIVTLDSQVTGAGGLGKAKEKMGKRRLAYSLGRVQDGFYVLLTIEGGGALVHEIERRLRVTEPVLKFITVRMDEEQKRLDKMKKLRDAKKRTVPPPPVTAETVAAPGAPAPATEASPGEAVTGGGDGGRMPSEGCVRDLAICS